MSDPPIPPPLPEVTEVNAQLVYATLIVTEDSVARVFEDMYQDYLRYCHAWGKWLLWDETRWREETTLLAFNYCRLISRNLNQKDGTKTAEKASFARGVEAFARSSRTFATHPEQWDREDMLLNCTDGTIDLGNSSSLREASQVDYITKRMRVTPKAGPSPVFDKFLNEITCGDESLAQYHKRSLGACLSGAVKDNFFLFWYGTGQNGKNTFGDLVMWMLGDYAKQIGVETLMNSKHGDKHPTDLATLRGLRLAVCSEVEEGSYFNEQRIKSLTGDTMISARFMRQDFFEFRRTHKHLVFGNHRPLLRVVDPGLRSRLHIVPFKAHFPPESKDPDMARKLMAEAPQILQWLIEGHQEWLEDGYLKKCSAVQDETDNYFEAQSTPEMWVSECCRLDEVARAGAKDLYKSYKAWKEQRGEGVISQTRWGEWMGQRYAKKNYSGRSVYVGIETILE